MKSCISSAALLLRAIGVAGAIGLASPASMALAQPGDGARSASSAAAAQPANVGGVVVQPAPKSSGISSKKRAALDAEAAKRKAWKKYRATTPTAAPASTPAAGVSASERAENYPGLHTLAH